ncbi:DUF58 domain-containing protein [Paenibacillus sp. NEAU-GSW1]|uniref:DUF58 domain-containing protein n=1 Tax=Paenibacillus sp. NEAU-GSW1 TaxID=2682486 RepID=UPI0012E1A352|nr:DUF58 domain-containing protein [Paenibacillus sp. NEAU-GSW1]MUT67377.1 DUF58 domain-containing protein [Paenibacillus sp. NEAU-GSW1]
MIIVWFGVIAVIVLFLQGKLFKIFALRKIGYQRHFQSRSCFRGEQIELVEQLTNEKGLPVPWLRVESQMPASLQFQHQENLDISSGQLSQNHNSFFSLMPFTKITRRHRITASRRGLYKLNTVTITGGDLLGIQQMTRQIPLSGQLIVYPKPAEVPVHELPSHSWQGDICVRRWIIEDPFVIAGTRDYRTGDTYKQVNWKATARAGKLQVHQYDFTADRKLMVYLNAEDREGMWRTITEEYLIEQGIEWTAGAVQYVIQAGMEAGFACNMPMLGGMDSTVIEPRGGNGHLFELFEAMARLELLRTEKFAELLEREADSAYSHRDIVIISAFWNDEMELQAERLRNNGNAVVCWPLVEHKDQVFVDERFGKAGAAG